MTTDKTTQSGAEGKTAVADPTPPSPPPPRRPGPPPPPAPATAERAPVVVVQDDPFARYAKLEHILPSVTEVPPEEHFDPNAFPPEIQAIHGQEFMFVWVRRPGRDERDHANLKDYERAGYTLVTRANFGDRLSDDNFAPSGAVELRGQVLMVTYTAWVDERRKRAIEKGALQHETARKGTLDDQGPIEGVFDATETHLTDTPRLLPGQITAETRYIESETGL